MSREKIENYDDQLLTPAESIVVASHSINFINGMEIHCIFSCGINEAHEGVELKLRPSFFPPGA